MPLSLSFGSSIFELSPPLEVFTEKSPPNAPFLSSFFFFPFFVKFRFFSFLRSPISSSLSVSNQYVFKYVYRGFFTPLRFFPFLILSMSVFQRLPANCLASRNVVIVYRSDFILEMLSWNNLYFKLHFEIVMRLSNVSN